MNWDDVIYISLLLFSILFGTIYIRVPKGACRQWVGTIIGFSIVVLVSGYHSFHPIFMCCCNLLILKFISARLCHMVSFAFTFSYLLLFRQCHYFGIPDAPGHTNAIQMMITLKLVGLCYEVHDTWQLKKDILKATIAVKDAENDTQFSAVNDEDHMMEVRKRSATERSGEKNSSAQFESKARSCREVLDELQLRLKHESVEPSAMEVIHYAFNYCGVLTGPYCKYQVFDDLIQGRSGGVRLNTWVWCLRRLRPLPLYAVLFILSDHFFPLKFAESEDIFSYHGIGYRWLYMTPVFFTFRMRIYSGFVLSECVCIMAGLGAYPAESKPRPGKGPTDYKALNNNLDNDAYSFEAVHNIDEYGADFSPTVRSGMRSWNMTVQYWLATNVYRRMKAPRPVKEAVTMLTSAFWHGMYPGYYLSMLTVPFILVVEDFYERIIRRRLSAEGAVMYDWITWIFKMQWFAYMGMAFLLLRVDTTLAYWRSVGFAGHGLILLLIAFGQFINIVLARVKSKVRKVQSTICSEDMRMRIKSFSNSPISDQKTESTVGDNDLKYE